MDERLVAVTVEKVTLQKENAQQRETLQVRRHAVVGPTLLRECGFLRLRRSHGLGTPSSCTVVARKAAVALCATVAKGLHGVAERPKPGPATPTRLLLRAFAGLADKTTMIKPLACAMFKA